MIESAKKSLPTILGGLLRTARRCNYIGCAICALILFASAWVLRNADSFAADPRFTDQQIREARLLLNNAEAVRSRNATQFILMNQNQLRVSKIKGWLATEFDWQKSSSHIETLATQANVKVISLDNALQHKGQRVAVEVINCECEGDFAEICRFLHLLSTDRSAAWCDSIRLYRNTIDDEDDTECSASISIRIPVLGPNTAAERLFAMEPPNAT